MATAVRQKSMLETKAYPLDMAALMPDGALFTAVQMTASRTPPFPLQPTTLFTSVAIGETTLALNVDPGPGARLVLEPGTGAEEKLKVISTTPNAGHWDCVVRPGAWVVHASNAPVSYEPGVNARLFVDDTPTWAGSVVTPMIHRGAYLQKYRISYLGDLNNGESIEDEFILEVVDPIPSVTNIKQPSEIRDLAADFTKLLEEPHQAGATLSSAVLYVPSAVDTATSNLAAVANPGAATISLNAHPGIGAMLTLTPAGLITSNTPPERVYVSNVTGSGPYTVSIVPTLEFSHVNGADVTVYQGFSGAFVTSVNSTFQGLFAINRARGGQAGKLLKLVWVATTSQGEVLQVSGLVSIEEEA